MSYKLFHSFTALERNLIVKLFHIISQCLAVQAYPDKNALAGALRESLKGQGGGRARLSRLKRLILKERTEKVVTLAVDGVRAAEEAEERVMGTREYVRNQLKVRVFPV